MEVGDRRPLIVLLLRWAAGALMFGVILSVVRSFRLERERGGPGVDPSSDAFDPAARMELLPDPP